MYRGWGGWNETNGRDSVSKAGPWDGCGVAEGMRWKRERENRREQERREGTYKPVSNPPASGAHREAIDVCATVWFLELLNV